MCNSIESSLSSKITIKEIHETYWRCRDFELSHLWQRSIFLSAFLILCFTGYGALISKMIDMGNVNKLAYVNLLAFLVSIIGIIFSCLWIMMGKGSKAWYERYENAILAFECNNHYVEPIAAHIGGFQYGNLPDYKWLPINKNLFKGNGGAYSPSKINIAIGQVTFILWSIAAFSHAVLGIIWLCKKSFAPTYCIISPIIIGGGILSLIIFFFLVFYQRFHWLHSPTLNRV